MKKFVLLIILFSTSFTYALAHQPKLIGLSQMEVDGFQTKCHINGL